MNEPKRNINELEQALFANNMISLCSCPPHLIDVTNIQIKILLLFIYFGAVVDVIP